MSFKDFVAFVLRMSGFWLVINTLVGISSSSFLFTIGPNVQEFGDQTPLVVVSILVPVVIGFLLAFMPYRIANFFVLGNEKISATPEFCGLLTRVGVALLGIYIMVTGIQYFAYNLALYASFSADFLEQYQQEANLKSSLISQGIRIVVGFCLVLGSKVISLKLSRSWFMAKSF